MPKDVLVIGAGGYIGREVVRTLWQQGWRVVALMRQAPSELDWQDSNVIWLNADANQEGVLRQILREYHVNRVVDAAWLGASPGLMNDPRNAEAADALVARWQQCGAEEVQHWLGFGSCAEYAWGGMQALTESSASKPAKVYGQAKLSAFRRIFKQRSSVKQTWLRPFFVYGGSDHPHRLLPSLVNAAQKNQAHGLREPRRCLDFVQVGDVARIAAAVLERGIDGVLNVGSGQGVAVGAVAQWVEAAVSAAPPATVPIEFGVAGCEDSVIADTRNLVQQIGWQPMPISSETVQIAVRDYLQALRKGRDRA